MPEPVSGGARQPAGPGAGSWRALGLILVVAGSVYCAITPRAWQPIGPGCGMGVMGGVLAVIVAGSVFTCIRRLAAIARDLRGRGPA